MTMGRLKSLVYQTLDLSKPEQVIQSVEVLHLCFPGNDRYTIERLINELRLSSDVFYRKFFVATVPERNQERVVGVAGIKAADWASDTHILYLSAVHPEFRNQGIGKTLLKLRVEWVKSEFKHGRVLVSTAKLDRFKQFKFRLATRSCEKGRSLMVMEF